MEQAKKKTAPATSLDEKIANVRKQNKREVCVIVLLVVWCSMK